MKIMKSNPCSAAIAAICLTILSACSGGGSDASTTTDTASAPTSTPTPPSTPTTPTAGQGCAAAAINPAEAFSLVFKGCSVAGVAEYYDKTQCVRQNSTGLIWQGQTPAGTGLRANDKYFSNLDSTLAEQKYDTNVMGFYRYPTQAEIDDGSNSIGFKNAVNATNLCGSNAWRLPTVDELATLVKTSEKPTIDNTWFPNMTDQNYWTSTTFGANTSFAMSIDFNLGLANGRSRGDANALVRLVR
jgi:Protein of unknown function (DUF1566)